MLPLPLDASNTQPLVNALMGDDALAQVQVLLKLPVQVWCVMCVVCDVCGV